MSTDIKALNLRIPADLHRRLTEAAAANNRSLNAEMTSRLVASFYKLPASSSFLDRGRRPATAEAFNAQPWALKIEPKKNGEWHILNRDGSKVATAWKERDAVFFAFMWIDMGFAEAESEANKSA